MQPLQASVLAAAAAFLAVLGVAARGHGPAAGRCGTSRRRSSGFGLRRAVGSVPVLARLGGTARLAVKLEAAGSGRSVAELVGERWVAAAGGSVLGLVSPVPALSVLLGSIGFLAPEWSLARAARRRRATAAKELPLLLDVVAAAAGAGLTGQLAVRRATAAAQGPLADELGEAIRRVDLGGRWSEELLGAAERLELPDLHRAVAVLTRGDSLGSPLSEALTEIAREARDARRDLVAERARSAPVKMLFPLVFLVLPAFLLLTVVPVLVTTLRSIG